MGIVIRQSSISAIFVYLGFLVGYVNVLWLFPSFLSTEEIGLINVLPSTALLLLPFAQLGLPNSLLKFYPELKKNEKGTAQLLGLLIIGVCLGLMVFGGIMVIFKQPIHTYFSTKSSLINDYFHVVIVLSIIFAFQALFEIYVRTLYKIIVLNFIKEVLTRLLKSVAVMLYFLEYITFSELANGLIVVYSIALISLLIYLAYLRKLSISFRFDLINTELIKKIINYSFFALLGSSGGAILLNIDQAMISSTLGLSQNGIYTTAFYIGVVIEMARRPISQITMPFVSEAFDKTDTSAIKKIYQQVSINQMIIGSLFFIGITCNLDNLYQLIPNNEVFILGKWVVVFIGLAKLVDMTFGINGEIIVMSDYYKFNVITVLFLALLTIFLNYMFIPIYGMNGAAFATLLSLVLFNLVKMVFISIKLHIIPFTLKNLTMIGIIACTFITGLYFPKLDNIVLDIAVRSIVISVFFGVLVYILKISVEVNNLLKMVMNKVLKA